MSEQPEKRLYIVFSQDAEVQSAADNFEDKFRLGKDTVLIRTDMLADDVASKIGVTGEDGSKGGVVIKTNNTYTGFFDSRLWDWLD